MTLLTWAYSLRTSNIFDAITCGKYLLVSIIPLQNPYKAYTMTSVKHFQTVLDSIKEETICISNKLVIKNITDPFIKLH